MKSKTRIRAKVLGLFLAPFLSFSSSAVASEACGELTVGWIDWPPYQMVGKSGDDTMPVGVDIAAAEKYLRAIGCDLKYISKPWARLLKSMEEGELDVLLGMSNTEERRKYANFSHPYRNETIWLFMRTDEHDYDHFTNLRDIIGSKFRLGVSRNAYLGDEFDALVENPLFKERVYQTIGGENFQMLMGGRVDGFLVDMETGKARVKEKGLEGKVGPHEKLKIDLGPIHIMLGKNSLSPELLEKLNALIKEEVAGVQS